MPMKMSPLCCIYIIFIYFRQSALPLDSRGVHCRVFPLKFPNQNVVCIAHFMPACQIICITIKRRKSWKSLLHCCIFWWGHHVATGSFTKVSGYNHMCNCCHLWSLETKTANPFLHIYWNYTVFTSVLRRFRFSSVLCEPLFFVRRILFCICFSFIPLFT
jgi:hypothetical protein